MNSGIQKKQNEAKGFNLLLFLCFLCAFALGIKNLREPDLWWQIRTGEWILDHFRIPSTDVFSYTYFGTPWINVKWGYEVIAALIAKLAGAVNVSILQAIVNVFIVFFLVKTTHALRRNMNPVAGENTSFSWILIVSLLCFLLGVEYRMTGRPEMFSHFFSAIFLFLYAEYEKRPGNKLLLIIPLQGIWANMHEAFGTGIVISMIFCFAALLEFILNKKDPGTKKRAIRISMILLFSILAVCFNPYGPKLLLQPVHILNQVSVNKYTTEMLSYASAAFWKKEAWMATIMLIISVSFFVHALRKKKNKRFIIFPQIVLFSAFAFLGLSAYRNIVFFIIVLFPWFTFGLEWICSPLLSNSRIQHFIRYVLALLIFVFYVLIVSNQYYKMTDSHDRFGLEMPVIHHPVGAVEYIRAKNMQQGKCFSDYLSSSYLLYALRPDFKTYIDLRDLDVFPPEFFDEYLHQVNDPKEFFKLDAKMHFDYVVLYRVQNQPLHAALYNDSIYALTYLDANSAVYEKTDVFSREDIFSGSKPLQAGIFSNLVNHVLNPFYKSIDLTSVDYNELAGLYYLNVYRFDLAARRAENMKMKNKNPEKGLELLGKIAYQKAIRMGGGDEKLKLLNESEQHFLESLKLNQKSAESHFGLAMVYTQIASATAALKELDLALQANDDYLSAHVAAAQINKKLYLESSDLTKAKAMLGHLNKAERLNPGNPEIQFDEGLGYFYLGEYRNASRYLKKALANPSLQDYSRTLAGKYLKETELKLSN